MKHDLPLPPRADKRSVEKTLDLLDETPLLRRSAATAAAPALGGKI